MKKCKVCLGTGTIIIDENGDVFGDCPECNGSGKCE
jgi:hypothetical protein